LGVFEGDLQLISQDSTKERQPIYSVFEIFRLDIILGNTGDNPALMSQGVFEIYGVESDTLSNFTEFTHIDKAYSEKLSSLLVGLFLNAIFMLILGKQQLFSGGNAKEAKYGYFIIR
jgi:hypothetical protein